MRIAVILIASLIAAGGLAAHAADDSAKSAQRAVAKEKWDSMSPEEKAAARKKMREKWESMTPEQKAEAKKRFAAKKAESGKTDEKKDTNQPGTGSGTAATGK